MRVLTSLAEIASDYDAIVFDQWGVLHDGATPYPRAVQAVQHLHDQGNVLAVLSNSGKRASPNAARIAALGFPDVWFHTVMTSGEALWRDVAQGRIEAKSILPIERAPGDASDWAKGLDLALVDHPEAADAILLMGLPDGSELSHWSRIMESARKLGLPVYCSNPDRASPRAGGKTVVSPGALAFHHLDAGGEVSLYGKPHRPIFDALQSALGVTRLLMVGDSLEHDIAGGHAAGWDTALIKGGLYAKDFAQDSAEAVLSRLVKEKRAPNPTYVIEDLR
ncbi:MAG: TIGR01459 family HAD-type hydrolase [Rhodobacteraceae bacterium]|nr:TIGR01459 family HAD-type hydrolase [Paracoccaceae bacterium]